MDPVIVSVTDGDEFPISLVVTNTPGSLVDVSVTEPATNPIDVTVTQPSVNVVDVTVTENVVGPVEVAVTEGTPSEVQVSVTEIVPAPIEVDVKVMTGKAGPPGEAPFGVALPFFGSAAPTDFAFPVGQTLARATYPDLAEVIAPDSGSPYWIDSTNFLMPDLRNKVLAGLGPDAWSDTLDKSGGDKDSVVVSHTHPDDFNNVHTHQINPPSTGTSSDGHSHTTNPPNTGVSFSATLRASGQLYESGSSSYVNAGSFGTAVTAAVNIGSVTSSTDSHTHTVDIAEFTSGGRSDGLTGGVQSEGVSGADKNLPPYLTCNYIMRLL